MENVAQSPITRDPDVMGGELVFAGTRVPVSGLFNYLEAGESLEEFLDGYPSVQREQAVAVLALAKQTLLTSAR